MVFIMFISMPSLNLSMARVAIDELEEQVQDIPVGPITGNKWTGSKSVLEAIRYQVQLVGYKNTYRPFGNFEAEPDGDNNYKVNVGWFDSVKYEPEVAFEIAGGVPHHSIEKLQKLPDSVTKVIVSKSKNQTYVREQRKDRLPDSFRHIDCEFWK